MKKMLLIILSLTTIVGCQNLNIKTTKSWEGHYLNVDDFYDKTNNISLEENESIWVISDDTLEYILKSR